MERVFQGRIIYVEAGIATLPNQQQMKIEVVRHPGGATVVALDDEQRVCMLHQYRVATDTWLWELPAGKIDNKEPPFETLNANSLKRPAAKRRCGSPWGRSFPRRVCSTR